MSFTRGSKPPSRACGQAFVRPWKIARPPNPLVVFTGHSLGGALAVIAAERAMRANIAQATCVYTFGSPRTGGSAFFDRYTQRLGDVTFRLVHGTDIVATVPPALNNRFLHVGRLIQCPTDGRF